jgi:ATP-dependent Clp protease ATP-binding subunit ClpA
MTTNIGSDAINYTGIGFKNKSENKNSDVLSSLKKYFPNDLLNRIDEIVIYNLLSDNQIKTILNKELQSFKQDLYSRGINIKFSSEVSDFLFNKIQFDNFGERQVIKTIQRELQTKIAERMIESEKKTNLEISVKDEDICVI